MTLACDFHLQRTRFRLHACLQTDARITGVFGPSGSGKSTLLHLIAGLVQPDSGRLEVDGIVLFDHAKRINVPPHQRRIGIVFQDSQLFPHLTVRQNLCYGLHLLSDHQRRLQPAQIIELLELEDLLQQRPGQLSGGQKQRVALGRALLACPRLLLLDEPLAALDERLKQQILPFLQRVKDETAIPMLYVSHAINEILFLSQRLAVLDEGRIVDHGDFADIIRKPDVLRLAQTLGLENVLAVDVTAHDNAMGFTLGRYHEHAVFLPFSAARPGSRAFVVARAGSVALARHKVTDTTIQNQLPGSIRRLTPIAQRVLVEVDIGQPLLAEISLKSAHDLQLRVGDTVMCLIKSQSFTFLGSAT